MIPITTPITPPAAVAAKLMVVDRTANITITRPAVAARMAGIITTIITHHTGGGGSQGGGGTGGGGSQGGGGTGGGGSQVDSPYFRGPSEAIPEQSVGGGSS